MMTAPIIDCDDDTLDGVLFRFWIRAACAWPGEAAIAIAMCTTSKLYRRALLDLAARKRVNLPITEKEEVMK